MNPILQDRKALVLYLLAWAVLAALLTAILAVSGKALWPAAAAFSFPMMTVYAFMSLSAWYVCRAFPLRGSSPPLVVTVVMLAAIFSGLLWSFIGYGWALIMDSLHAGFEATVWQRQASPLLAATGVALYLLSTAVHYLLLAFQASRDVERRALELQVLARDAELKALRSQINPHFLFNSLNSISALTAGAPTLARAMTLKLADFLRSSMDVTARTTVTVDQELALAMQFLDIERTRFGNRLRVETAIDEDAREYHVPPLLLQPLVENAVNHGIAHLVEGGTIRIAVHANGGALLISVENPIDPDRPIRRGQGVGTENVRQRIQRLYGTAGRMETNCSEEMFSVTLAIPALSRGAT